LGQESSTSAAAAQPLFASLAAEDEPPALLPLMPAEQQVLSDYNTVGLTLREHPLSFHRSDLDALQVSPARQLARLRHGRLVRVAGLVLMRQRPGTAKGITFVTLEDETGTSNLIVHQKIWQRFYQAARTATALLAHGRLQREGEVIHVLVSRLEDLTERLPGLKKRSRDFQ
jgi:error-prone DNA polymerase